MDFQASWSYTARPCLKTKTKPCKQPRTEWWWIAPGKPPPRRDRAGVHTDSQGQQQRSQDPHRFRTDGSQLRQGGGHGLSLDTRQQRGHHWVYQPLSRASPVPVSRRPTQDELSGMSMDFFVHSASPPTTTCFIRLVFCLLVLPFIFMESFCFFFFF